MNPIFQFPNYLLRRQAIALTGKFRFYDPAGRLVMFSEQKMFRLKEDIRIYGDESKTQEVLSVRARQIMDFSAAYDVVDTEMNQKVGALRRKGWSSLARDSWMLLNARDQEIGTVVEDSMIAALVRRFVDAASLFMPQKFHADMGGQTVCTYQQNFNPFVRRLTVDFTHDRNGQLDKRLGLAAAILLSAIEGKQG